MGRETLRPKRLLELRKVGPGKSWIGRSKATEQIQDHHFLPPCNPGHGFGPRTPKSPMSKTAIRVEKSGSWEVRIGRSKAIELVQDHHFFPTHNPGHGNWPRSPKAKTAIRSEKSGSWEVLDW